MAENCDGGKWLRVRAGGRLPVAYPLAERKLLHFLIGISAVGVMFGMTYLGARRFEKKQRELGRRDQ